MAKWQIYALVNNVNIGSGASRRTNANILPIRAQRIYFNETLFESQIFSFEKIQFKMSSAKWRPLCLGPNVLDKSCHHDKPYD